ncbi:MAG TPA: hypothetical protein DIC32_14535 [Acinetobacter radioresistens]|uniref:Sialate O-acetylesterase domain-containing protein n=1 Tax=Acinetobacter radioresistens TaxID=40216 RepID=A0A3D3G394_ACIRA|nr:hypothetical protein [Acinetobacter radioresistens]
MPIISVEKLEDANLDVDSIDKFVSGSEDEEITTRRGRKIPTMAKIANLAQSYTQDALAAKDAAESIAANAQANVDAAQAAVGSTKNYVDTALSAFSGPATKFFPTVAAANAAIATIGTGEAVWIGDQATGGLYEKLTAGATTVTKSGFDPLTQAKAYTDVKVTQDGDGVTIKDKLGFTLLKIFSKDGVLNLETPFFNFNEVSSLLTMKDSLGFSFSLVDFISQFQNDFDGYSIRVKDKFGFVSDLDTRLFNIENKLLDLPNQVKINPALELQAKANAVMQSHLKPYRHPCATIKKGLNIVIVYGQSFSLGAQAATVVTRTPSPRGNLMLGGSPRGKHGELVDTNYTFDPFGGNIYQPLQECGQTKDGVIVNLDTNAGYYGETISSGLVESLKDYWNREKGVINDIDVTFAISCCGTGGATHDQLKKSTGTFYNRFLTCLDGHIAAAATAGFTSVQVVGVVYLHGESMAGAAKATYKANLAEMRSDMIADIKSKFGQADEPAFFIHQIGGDYPASVSTQLGTSQAQLEFASETEGVFICDNEFGYPTPGAHLYPNGYRWLGCRFAKRMYPVLRDKQTIPFKIIDAVYKDGAVYVAFNSPTALKTRTVYKGVTAVNDPTMGFTVRNSSAAVTITAAEFVSESVVKLTLASIQTDALTLWLGSSYNNGTHNLCDSNEEKSIFNYFYDGTKQQSAAENIAEYVGKPYQLNEKPLIQFINVRSI